MPHLDIPPPAKWEDFEDLCLDLWRLIWDDPRARKHGRCGQEQAGVDVYGQPKGGSGWEGVQCKLKSQILGKKLTRKEIEEEVSNALAFEPALAAFTFATTASRTGRTPRPAVPCSTATGAPRFLEAAGAAALEQAGRILVRRT